MNSRVLAGVCLGAALLVGGCRQGDGPLPKADGDVPNRVHDLGRDLQSVAGGDQQAPKDLEDDLLVFVDSNEPRPPVIQLARVVSDSVAKKQLSDQNAEKLGQQLWMTVAARQLSEKQREALQKDVQTTLTSMGVAQDSAERVSAQVGETQKALTRRKRRWYEFF
jgi:hypothetical protein